MNPEVAASPQLVEGGLVATRGSQQYLLEVAKGDPGRYCLVDSAKKLQFTM